MTVAVMTVAALFVGRDGCYYGLPGVEPWDEERDARNYLGPWPVVAHPPCSRWCRLSGHAEAMSIRRNHQYPPLPFASEWFIRRRGVDGGCFKTALADVRRWGGVLEHPAYTDAWSAFGLPNPPKDAWGETQCDGWVTHVEQGMYGHPARKPTWLYFHGMDEPREMKWGATPDGDIRGICCGRGRSKSEEIPKSARSATPVAFRDILLAIARSGRG